MPGQTEISEFHNHVGEDEDVARGDVAVDHLVFALQVV